MAIASVPVLKGAASERFEQQMKESESRRGSVDFTKSIPCLMKYYTHFFWYIWDCKWNCTPKLMIKNSDILENDLLAFDSELLPILLTDRSKSNATGEPHNIVWGTDNYTSNGEGYGEWDEISVPAISGEHGLILQPRVNKTKEEQEHRSRVKAEVFTPVWICNKQNNLIDAAWFGGTAPFNTENEDNTWTTSTERIPFPTLDGKTWEDYVKDTRLEVSCGEAPYLVSRYGVVSGIDIDIKDRIGILDRKLRVIFSYERSN